MPPNFRISHNSIPRHFSYFNPYRDPELPHRTLEKKKHRISQSEASSIPGPGNYDISLPIVKPKFSTIIKNENAIIVKVNDTVQGTSSFKSKFDRFKFRGSKSPIPGPGTYSKSQSKSIDLEEREKEFQKQRKLREEIRVAKNRYIQSILKK